LAVNNYAKGQCSLFGIYGVSAVSSPRQIGPIFAWPSGKVARVMAEHIGGSRAATASSGYGAL
jgi:hypothetical protein